MRVNIGIPVVRMDGRSVARSVGHVITKFSGMGRFIYPWCSAGALRARSSAIIYFDFKFIFEKKAVYCLNILVEHVVSCKGFRVRRNCKGLSLIILVRLL